MMKWATIDFVTFGPKYHVMIFPRRARKDLRDHEAQYILIVNEIWIVSGAWGMLDVTTN